MGVPHGSKIFWKVSVRLNKGVNYNYKYFIVKICMVTYILYLYIYQLTHLQRIFGFIVGGRLHSHFNNFLE